MSTGTLSSSLGAAKTVLSTLREWSRVKAVAYAVDSPEGNTLHTILAPLFRCPPTQAGPPELGLADLSRGANLELCACQPLRRPWGRGRSS